MPTSLSTSAFSSNVPPSSLSVPLSTLSATAVLTLPLSAASPYVRLAALDPSPVYALAAPVLSPSRYQSRPIYYSDVIVHADSHFQNFNHLQGHSWAYNEPDSHSGYLLPLFHLLATGRTPDFFSSRVRTDFHANSLRAVANGLIDASAIDSHLLSVELSLQPSLASQIRIIDTLGPSSIQPLVACSHVPRTLREDVLEVLTSLSATTHPALRKALVDTFVPIPDAQYDDIRAMLLAVEQADLAL